MSQDDLFGDTDDVDDPDSVFGTPTEFSGVSAGSSAHASPAITRNVVVPSPVLTPIPSPSTSTSPAVPQVYSCPVCKSKLKTERGFIKHVERHNIPGIVATISRPLSTVSANATSVQPSKSSTSTATTQPSGFFCRDCKKTLKTQSGFLKHRANHKLKDADKRKPTAADFHSIASATMAQICDEILAEPSYGDSGDKIMKFMEEFKLQAECREWVDFVGSFSDKICEIVLVQQKKMLPLNQYEESQSKLSNLLCQDEVMCEFAIKLRSVCSEEISTVQANRLVFRMAFKLLGAIQVWVAKAMMANRPSSQSSASKEMSVMHKHAFSHTLGDIFRDFYRRGMKSSSKQWHCRSACLIDTFVDGQHPISSEVFLDKEMWFTGDESSIVPTDNAVGFFMIVETVVMDCSEEHCLSTVTEQILDDWTALNYWYHLTSSHFSEDNSLLFMKDLIHVFTRRTLLLKEKKKNREEEKSARATQAALRTHLKRNYPEKDDQLETVCDTPV